MVCSRLRSGNLRLRQGVWTYHRSWADGGHHDLLFTVARHEEPDPPIMSLSHFESPAIISISKVPAGSIMILILTLLAGLGSGPAEDKKSGDGKNTGE